MTCSSAEHHFNKGLAALAEGLPDEAAEFFLTAMQIERRRSVRRPDMRYLSYYGLSLAQAGRATQPALEACEMAVRRDPVQPTLLLNLGRVYVLAGKKGQALACFEHGLRLAPRHPQLRREMDHRNRRAAPVIPLLARSHALNRWAGQIRASVKSKPPRSPSSPQP